MEEVICPEARDYYPETREYIVQIDGQNLGFFECPIQDFHAVAIGFAAICAHSIRYKFLDWGLQIRADGARLTWYLPGLAEPILRANLLWDDTLPFSVVAQFTWDDMLSPVAIVSLLVEAIQTRVAQLEKRPENPSKS